MLLANILHGTILKQSRIITGYEIRMKSIWSFKQLKVSERKFTKFIECYQKRIGFCIQ